MDFHLHPAAADDADAIAGILANMAKPAAASNAARTSKALDVPLEVNEALVLFAAAVTAAALLI